MKWCIYYGDGSTYTDDTGEACYAPKSGVQAIVVVDPAVHHYILTGSDFYCYDPNWTPPVWRNMDSWGFQEYMREPGPRVAIFGKWIGNHEYQALTGRIIKEWGEGQKYPHDRT